MERIAKEQMKKKQRKKENHNWEKIIKKTDNNKERWN